jgi:hypothetical protein
MPETAMRGVLLKSSEVHLSSLFTGNPNMAMDDMLNQFSTYDRDC